ncbi:MAG: hypothetical protein AVDCRST_MAG89-1901, partial [uncultured Gemmatimonadetes bacterium]
DPAPVRPGSRHRRPSRGGFRAGQHGRGSRAGVRRGGHARVPFRHQLPRPVDDARPRSRAEPGHLRGRADAHRARRRQPDRLPALPREGRKGVRLPLREQAAVARAGGRPQGNGRGARAAGPGELPAAQRPDRFRAADGRHRRPARGPRAVRNARRPAPGPVSPGVRGNAGHGRGAPRGALGRRGGDRGHRRHAGGAGGRPAQPPGRRGVPGGAAAGPGDERLGPPRRPVPLGGDRLGRRAGVAPHSARPRLRVRGLRRVPHRPRSVRAGQGGGVRAGAGNLRAGGPGDRGGPAAAGRAGPRRLGLGDGRPARPADGPHDRPGRAADPRRALRPALRTDRTHPARAPRRASRRGGGVRRAAGQRARGIRHRRRRNGRRRSHGRLAGGAHPPRHERGAGRAALPPPLRRERNARGAGVDARRRRPRGRPRPGHDPGAAAGRGRRRRVRERGPRRAHRHLRRPRAEPLSRRAGRGGRHARVRAAGCAPRRGDRPPARLGRQQRHVRPLRGRPSLRRPGGGRRAVAHALRLPALSVGHALVGARAVGAPVRPLRRGGVRRAPVDGERRFRRPLRPRVGPGGDGVLRLRQRHPPAAGPGPSRLHRLGAAAAGGAHAGGAVLRALHPDHGAGGALHRSRGAGRHAGGRPRGGRRARDGNLLRRGRTRGGVLGRARRPDVSPPRIHPGGERGRVSRRGRRPVRRGRPRRVRAGGGRGNGLPVRRARARAGAAGRRAGHLGPLSHPV